MISSTNLTFWTLTIKVMKLLLNYCRIKIENVWGSTLVEQNCRLCSWNWDRNWGMCLKWIQAQPNIWICYYLTNFKVATGENCITNLAAAVWLSHNINISDWNFGGFCFMVFVCTMLCTVCSNYFWYFALSFLLFSMANINNLLLLTYLLVDFKEGMHPNSVTFKMTIVVWTVIVLN